MSSGLWFSVFSQAPEGHLVTQIRKLGCGQSWAPHSDLRGLEAVAGPGHHPPPGCCHGHSLSPHASGLDRHSSLRLRWRREGPSCDPLVSEQGQRAPGRIRLRSGISLKLRANHPSPSMLARETRRAQHDGRRLLAPRLSARGQDGSNQEPKCKEPALWNEGEDGFLKARNSLRTEEFPLSSHET